MTYSADLAATSMFSDMPAECIERLSPHVTELIAEQGITLFHQGANPTHLHLLLDGCVQLTASGTQNEQAVIELIAPGQHFILAAVLLGKPYLMSAQAGEMSRLLLIAAEPLNRLMREHNALAVKMATALSYEFRAMVRRVRDERLRSTAQRLASYLLELDAVRKGPEFLLPLSKKLMASYLNMSPETLSRALNLLRGQGVSIENNRVHIASRARLRRFCMFDENLDLAESTADQH